MPSKSNILLVGGGSVGTRAAYNLEIGGKAAVTAVLRSNYHAVSQYGFTMKSFEHGFVDVWKPTNGKLRSLIIWGMLMIWTVINSIPQTAFEIAPFDFIVVTTKNVADIHPTVANIISPAVTINHTCIVLVQNGLNIEKPLVTKFPSNTILSSVTLIGATETQPGHVTHDSPDIMTIGAFENPNVLINTSVAAAHQFLELYKASGKLQCSYSAVVGYFRWKKLVYNACYNSVCAITCMDTGRMRLHQFPINILIKPLMREILAIAEAAGHILSENYIEELINGGTIQSFFKSSMQ